MTTIFGMVQIPFKGRSVTEDRNFSEETHEDPVKPLNGINTLGFRVALALRKRYAPIANFLAWFAFPSISARISMGTTVREIK